MKLKNWFKRITKQTEDITFNYKLPLADCIKQIEKEYLLMGIKIIYTPDKHIIMNNGGMYFSHDKITQTKTLVKYQH